MLTCVIIQSFHFCDLRIDIGIFWYCLCNIYFLCKARCVVIFVSYFDTKYLLTNVGTAICDQWRWWIVCCIYFHIIKIPLFAVKFLPGCNVSSLRINLEQLCVVWQCVRYLQQDINFKCMTQAVSYSSINTTWVCQYQCQDSPLRTCGAQNGTGTGFISVFQISPVRIILSTLHTHISHIHYQYCIMLTNDIINNSIHSEFSIQIIYFLHTEYTVEVVCNQLHGAPSLLRR